MAKKKVVKRKAAKRSAARKTTKGLFKTHPNLVWLIPLYLAVVIIVMMIFK